MNIDAILRKATKEKIRLLIERDPDDRFRVWYDPEERDLIKTLFKGMNYRAVETQPYIRYPSVLPTYNELTRSIDDVKLRFGKRVPFVVSGGAMVFGELKEAPLVAQDADAVRSVGSMSEEYQAVRDAIGPDFGINIARDKTFVYT